MIKIEMNVEPRALEVVNFVLAQFGRELLTDDGNIDLDKAKIFCLTPKDIERVETFRNKLLQAGFYKIHKPKNVGGSAP